MKSKRDLENKLREIDHKSYKLYKDLRGSYDFKDYELCIDHVQGDPFATPSRVRLDFANRNNFPDELFSTKERKVALEDYLLRCLHRALRAGADGGNRGGGHGRGGGSGKSGLVACCPVGQEVLERTAVLVDKEKIEVRIEVGFPAYGRSIASQEMRKILFERIPDATVPVFSYADQNKKRIAQVVELADDQAFIRSEIEKLGLVSFIADGSILPRESGVSTRPMKDGKPFEAPESMAVTLKLPHRGELRGMGMRVVMLTGDNEKTADRMLEKLIKLRIFEDENGKTNLSIDKVGGEIMIISQFTLYANCKKGNRPSFIEAGDPDMANELYEYVIDRIKAENINVATGEFGADMQIELQNDGPFTICLNSKDLI